jgi:hypothetical protein
MEYPPGRLAQEKFYGYVMSTMEYSTSLVAWSRRSCTYSCMWRKPKWPDPGEIVQTGDVEYIPSSLVQVKLYRQLSMEYNLSSLVKQNLYRQSAIEYIPSSLVQELLCRQSSMKYNPSSMALVKLYRQSSMEFNPSSLVQEELYSLQWSTSSKPGPAEVIQTVITVSYREDWCTKNKCMFRILTIYF